jgi:ATP-dependent DNA helicase RecG
MIQTVIPHYKTDAILRRENLDRYDDRGTQRISIRDKIFREAITNLLIHREFSNPFPAKMVIEKNSVYTENGNKPHGNGIIDPEDFSPYPKNPKIAKFFKEIGWVDELGSGVRNTQAVIEDDPIKRLLEFFTTPDGNI